MLYRCSESGVNIRRTHCHVYHPNTNTIDRRRLFYAPTAASYHCATCTRVRLHGHVHCARIPMRSLGLLGRMRGLEAQPQRRIHTSKTLYARKPPRSARHAHSAIIHRRPRWRFRGLGRCHDGMDDCAGVCEQCAASQRCLYKCGPHSPMLPEAVYT